MAAILKNYPDVALNVDNLAGRIDFMDVFGRNWPVHIEIGSGKAAFLINQAKAGLQINFLGIEWANKYYRYSVDRIGRWGIKNVRIVRTDAAHFLATLIGDASVDCFHIYFPDPWPKRNHHKRRFFCDTNFDQLLRCLKPAGMIKIATDHEGYFEQMKAVLGGSNGSFEIVTFLPAAGAVDGELTGTNYERKYIKEKRPLYSVAVRKT